MRSSRATTARRCSDPWSQVGSESLRAADRECRRPRWPPAALSLEQPHREWIAGYLFVLPDALGLLVFVGGPMLLSLSLGFFRVNGFGGYAFVGLANYRRMIGDPLFLAEPARHARSMSCCWCRRSTSSGSASRCWCSAHTRFNGVCAAMLFVPQTVSLVVVALVWQFMLVDKIGLLSRLGATSVSAACRCSAIRRFALYRDRVHQRLVPDGLLHADLPRRPAGHSQGILRGRHDRRRQRRPVVPPHHPAAAAADQLLRACSSRRSPPSAARRPSTSST